MLLLFQGGLRAKSCRNVTVCLTAVHIATNGAYDFNTQYSRKYDYAIYSLSNTVHRLGGSACVRSIIPEYALDFSQCESAKSIILLGFHLLGTKFPPSFQTPNNLIIYNVEQVQNSWLNDDSLRLLKANQVWDSRAKNVQHFRKFDIHAHHVPVGYANGITYVEPPRKKKYKKDKNGKKVRIIEPKFVPDIDVLLIEPCNARRSAVIKALTQKGLTVRISTVAGLQGCSVLDGVTLPPMFGLPLIKLLKRAKIVLHMHDSETGGVFDIERISLFLANSKYVISEIGEDKEAEKEFQGGITFVTFQTIIETCMQYVNNEKARDVVSDMGWKLISHCDNAPQVRCPLFGSRLVVNSGKNTYTSDYFPSVPATRYRITSSQLITFTKEIIVPNCFRIVAVVTGHNNAEVLYSLLDSLMVQEIDVHYVDLGSSDNSMAIIKRWHRMFPHKITIEKYPVGMQLSINYDRLNALASSIKADWILMIDANELLESPWGAKISLRRAIYVADQLGYNLIGRRESFTFHVTKDINASRRDIRRTAQNFLYANTANMDYILGWKSYYSTCSEDYIEYKPAAGEFSSVNSTFHYIKSPQYFFPGHHLFPYSFLSRRYDYVSGKSDYMNHSIVHSVYDNGDIPARFLSSFLPCLQPQIRYI